MINKLGIVAVTLAMFYGATEFAQPAAILKNGAGHQVYVYELPQQATESAVADLIKEFKDLPKQGVEQLLIDDISAANFAKVNSTLARLVGKQAWDEIGIPVQYLDVRVTERVALMIKTIGTLNAMDYLESNNLEQIYQQWGFTADQAKKMQGIYQKKFAPLCQQMRQMITKISNPPSQHEAEQLQMVGKKFEQCFLDHFFIIFGTTRKALTAEHNALMQEIASYKDGKLLEAEYKNLTEAFKESAHWLADTSVDETLSNYMRHCEILSDDEKQALQLLKQKAPSQAPAIDDINLMKIISEGLPLVAIRAVHAIVNSKKSVALFMLEPAIQDLVNDLLGKAGYTEVVS